MAGVARFLSMSKAAYSHESAVWYEKGASLSEALLSYIMLVPEGVLKLHKGYEVRAYEVDDSELGAASGLILK